MWFFENLFQPKEETVRPSQGARTVAENITPTVEPVTPVMAVDSVMPPVMMPITPVVPSVSNLADGSPYPPIPEWNVIEIAIEKSFEDVDK